MDGGTAGTGSEEERMLREYGLLGDGETSTSAAGGAAGSEPVLLPVLRAADVQLTSQELGSGAFGRVMLGRFHGRDVAVKLLPLLGPAHSRVALRREVAALASLSHRCSSMARLVGITVKDGRLALVMCRYQCSLAQSLVKQPGGRMASDEATLLARDLLRGLAQLHCHGVVMADLKPNNVLLDESGAPLLCDFGLSRAVRSTLGQHAALSHVAGTANYMSPEQFMVGTGGGGGGLAAGGAAGTSTNTSSTGADALISPKSDMWAFGCTMLHALTGRPPWAGLHIGQISMQVGVHKRGPDVPTDLPPNLRSLLLNCLQPDPARRPSAAEALASLEQELRRCIRTAPPPPRPAGASAPAAAAPPRPTHVKVAFHLFDWEAFRPCPAPITTLTAAVDPAETADLGGGMLELSVPVLPAYDAVLSRTAFAGIPRSSVQLVALRINRWGERTDCSAVGVTDPLTLRSYVAQPGGEPCARKVVVVDTLMPVTRVSVVLNGSWGSNQAVGVVVRTFYDSVDLAEEALSKLAPNARARRFQEGNFEMVVDGRRRHLPALMESGLIQQGAVLQMRERGEATMQVLVHVDEGTPAMTMLPVRVAPCWLVRELKTAVAEKRPDLAATVMEQYKMVRGETDCDDCKELSAYLITAAGGDFQVLHLVKRRPPQAAGAAAP
ncbi:hypothetical protein HXX76_003570 [Chlamydomonas incerta]|uniref:Protein kinase domain-containing protein n=1 Tax=Chlamydomonas incerta TaxID=51695 RepID=A0A835W7W6_CHLIN|nr:hypothetical protein HXX76_003570 [Chlamydomonas incerta]|eukprot:KAG2440713.1 hypothetical protein HXX76_003570 [Chlamydomonas incerta]